MSTTVHKPSLGQSANENGHMSGHGWLVDREM
jgi:hypothetical protein